MMHVECTKQIDLQDKIELGIIIFMLFRCRVAS